MFDRQDSLHIGEHGVRPDAALAVVDQHERGAVVEGTGGMQDEQDVV
jgi:hypothetical protein